MNWKTHLAIGVAVALYFSNFVSSPVIFIPVVLLTSILPDIDSGFSYLGKKSFFKPVQWTTNHRGILHSYTFCIFVSLILALFYPVLALPFFVGYSFHLIGDSFTVKGIKPFWPLKFISKGPVKTGGKIEKSIFFTFLFIDVILFASLMYSLI